MGGRQRHDRFVDATETSGDADANRRVGFDKHSCRVVDVADDVERLRVVESPAGESGDQFGVLFGRSEALPVARSR